MGETPRELADDAVAADWAPDDRTLAVLRESGRLRRIEYPLGKTVYRGEPISWLRVSRDGEMRVTSRQIGARLLS